MLLHEKFRWIDLTHPLSKIIPTWDGDCGFRLSNLTTHEDGQGDCRFLTQKMEMYAGVGTHIDAPLHCVPQGKAISALPLEELIAPCVVVDVSAKASEDYLLEMPAIQKFESEEGEISRGTFVIVRTGWDRFWNEPEKYHNNHKFPAISKEVADYLIAKDIVGLGVDTLSPDRPDSEFPVHQVVLGAGKYIVENIANASLMPASGGYVIVMPLPIVGASEAPIRLLGLIG